MRKILFLLSIIFLFSCEQEIKEEDFTEREVLNRFCWECMTKIVHKEYSCGRLVANGATFVSRRTKCDMTAVEIAIYESSAYSIKVREEPMEGCGLGYPYYEWTDETVVTCEKIDSE